MICIIFNGEKKFLRVNTTLKDILIEVEERFKPFAVAVNQHFVSQIHYATTLLKDGDEVEIITPMQGG